MQDSIEPHPPPPTTPPSDPDRDASDIDLMFTAGKPLSLMQLGDLERRISEAVGAPVDLVPESALRPELRARALSEAVAL